MCLQGAMPVPPSSKTNLWRRLPITERSGGRQDAEWLRETDSSHDPFYNQEFRKLAVYDNRYCPKLRFCLPIIRNAREFPLTESWFGLACGAALNRIALDSPTSNRSRVLP